MNCHLFADKEGNTITVTRKKQIIATIELIEGDYEAVLQLGRPEINAPKYLCRSLQSAWLMIGQCTSTDAVIHIHF
jgi:hypothetical protein